MAFLALNAALLPCARMGGGRTRRRLVGVAAVVILTVFSCAWSVARGGVGGNGPGRARVGGDGSENAPVLDGAIARKEDGWDGWDGEAGHAPLVGERRRRRLDEGVARSERVASNPAWQALTRQATLRDDPESCTGVCGLCTSSCCCDRDCRAVGDCCGDFEDVGVCQAQKDDGGGSVGDGTPPPSAPVGEVSTPPPAPFPPLPGVPPFPLYLYTKLQAVPRCVRLF